MPVLPEHPTANRTLNAPPRECRALPAIRLRQDGYDGGTVRELTGHADIEATMIYKHVVNKGGRAAGSTLDNLLALGAKRLLKFRPTT